MIKLAETKYFSTLKSNAYSQDQERSILVETAYFIVVEVFPYFQLIIPILGFIGFIGNVITFLQPELRTNTCAIYTLCSSCIDILRLAITIFPVYFERKTGYIPPWAYSSVLCKLYYFYYGFLPHLAINLLILGLIDRFACSCPLTSRIRRFNQLKMVPIMIFIMIIISAIVSIYGGALAYITPYGCDYTEVKVYGLCNIIFNGITQPIVMLVFVLLLYRNVRRSRQRVEGAIVTNQNRFRNQFIAMIITQVLTTAFLSLQWMIGQTYVFFINYDTRTIDEWYIVLMFFSFTISLYAMNNVKSFYFSMLTSKLYRQTFIKGCQRLFALFVKCRST